MLFVIVFGFAAGILWPLLLLVRGKQLRMIGGGAVRLSQRGAASRICAEFCTACLLVLSTSGLLRNTPWGVSLHLCALGMLAHSALSSLGGGGRWPIIASSLAALIGGTVSAIVLSS